MELPHLSLESGRTPGRAPGVRFSSNKRMEADHGRHSVSLKERPDRRSAQVRNNWEGNSHIEKPQDVREGRGSGTDEKERISDVYYCHLELLVHGI